MISLRIRQLRWLALLVASPCVTVASEATTAIVGANVITMTEDLVLPDQTVVVRGGRIVSVAASGTLNPPDGAQIVDGQGKYLMPGLVDMHVHLGLQRGTHDIEAPARNRHTDDELFLYVANGVTTVRNMQGSQYHLKLRARIARGEVIGPAIYTAGPLVDGVPPTWPSGHRILVKGADVHDFIRDYMEEGYDFLKTYSSLTDEMYEALLKEARRMKVRVVGHVPTNASLLHAVDHGQLSIEHLSGYDRVMQPPGVVELAPLPYAGWPSIDRTRMVQFAESVAAAGVWQCPTLVTLHNLGQDYGEDPGLAEALRSPGIEYVSPLRIAMWRASPLYAASAKELRTIVRAGQANRILMLGALYRAGAPILLGTDATAVFVVPGFSVAKELENLVDAGLSNYAALTAATSAPARFLGREGQFGIVRPGATADLLLLEANPLEEVGAVRSVAGVMLRGKWLTREDIDGTLLKIKQANQAGNVRR